jgi:hypothetical protein
LGLFVRIDEEYLKAVVFIGTEAGGAFAPTATGFLTAVRYGDTSFCFLVTAEHAVDQIHGDNFSVRMNRKTGDADTQKIPKSEKVSHSDGRNDIAMFNIAMGTDIWDQRWILLDRSDQEAAYSNIWHPSLGDEVAAIGLYTSHYGQIKNIPVVRTGHIAMLPGEPVLTDKGTVGEAYLTEVRSIAGLSGSPVFLNPPSFRSKEGRPQFLMTQKLVPLGMMLGYHLVASAQDQIIVPRHWDAEVQDGLQDDYSLDERNTGFAVVVPFERLLEMAESEAFQNKMADSLRQEQQKTGFRPASAKPEPSTKADNPQHKEDFSRLLDEAAKPRRSDDET